MFAYEQQDQDLNQLILTGQALDGFEKYYADDVSMQENNDTPTVGKAENLARELVFFGSIEKFNGASIVRRAASGDTSFAEWTMDYELKNGVHVQSTQIARRT